MYFALSSHPAAESDPCYTRTSNFLIWYHHVSPTS